MDLTKKEKWAQWKIKCCQRRETHTDQCKAPHLPYKMTRPSVTSDSAENCGTPGIGPWQTHPAYPVYKAPRVPVLPRSSCHFSYHRAQAPSRTPMRGDRPAVPVSCWQLLQGTGVGVVIQRTHQWSMSGIQPLFLSCPLSLPPEERVSQKFWQLQETWEDSKCSFLHWMMGKLRP